MSLMNKPTNRRSFLAKLLGYGGSPVRYTQFFAATAKGGKADKRVVVREGKVVMR